MEEIGALSARNLQVCCLTRHFLSAIWKETGRDRKKGKCYSERKKNHLINMMRNHLSNRVLNWKNSFSVLPICICVHSDIRGALALKGRGLMNQRKGSCDVIQKPLEFKCPQSLLCAIVVSGLPTLWPNGHKNFATPNSLCSETVDKSIELKQR